MKKTILIVFVLLVFSVDAQLIVSQATAVQAASVLLGRGVSVSGIRFKGNASQLGEFNGRSSNIGLRAGVIISCGAINSSVGPNNSDNKTLPIGGFEGSGDSNLDGLIGGDFKSGDAGILEFDFVPMGDTIKFKYVFGSEEYNEFVCGGVNDVFGFFLTGQNPLGGSYNAKNLAIVPGTVSTPVSINTINNGTLGRNGIASNCSAIDPNWASYKKFYRDNAKGSSVQYDGFTKVLEAKAYVVCGETYHIKFAIADGGEIVQDYTYDSGVFIQAESFSSNTINFNSSHAIGGADSILYEGCNSASLNFVRSNTTESAVYNYTVIGGSANASDYTISASNVAFLPGEDKVTLSFKAIHDEKIEPLETVTILFTQTICNAIDTQKVTFYISDFPTLEVTTHDGFQACENSAPVPIWVNVLGAPYTVSWNTTPRQYTDTIWVNPTENKQYIVAISDNCGVNTIIDTAEVIVLPPSPITLTMSPARSKYCIQDSVEIYVITEGGGGSYSYNWSALGNVDSNLYVNPKKTTTYEVEVTDVCGVIKKDSVTIRVPNFEPLSVNVLNLDDTVCKGDLVVLNGTITGGVGAYFSWNFELGNVSPINVKPLTTTTYILTGQDSCGANVKDSVTISTDLIQLHLPDSIALSCLEETVVLDPAISGGSGNETYSWSSGDESSRLIVTPTETMVYNVTVSTADGCPKLRDTVKVIVPDFIPLEVKVNTNISPKCSGDAVTLIASVEGGSSKPLVFNWSDGVNVFKGKNITVNPLETSTYRVKVVDICAKDSGESNFTVTVPIYAPLGFNIFSDDTLICLGSHANLEGYAIGGEGNYIYSWSNGANSESIKVSPAASKRYKLMVTDGCGSHIDTTVAVTVSEPIANFSFVQDALEIQFYNLSSSNIVTNAWTFYNGTSEEKDPFLKIDYDVPHDVRLLVTNIYGCLDSIKKTVRPPLLVYAPNSFTPNGDEINDEFLFKGVGIKSFKLLIYNRWGEIVFETDNIYKGWDGTYNGLKVPAGVYVYKFLAESYDNLHHKEVRKFTLIK